MYVIGSGMTFSATGTAQSLAIRLQKQTRAFWYRCNYLPCRTVSEQLRKVQLSQTQQALETQTLMAWKTLRESCSMGVNTTAGAANWLRLAVGKFSGVDTAIMTPSQTMKW